MFPGNKINVILSTHGVYGSATAARQKAYLDAIKRFAYATPVARWLKGERLGTVGRAMQHWDDIGVVGFGDPSSATGEEIVLSNWK